MHPPIAEYLTEALARTDPEGRFTARDAAKLRPLAARLKPGPSSLLRSPEQFFGPWALLPTHVQANLRVLAEAEIRANMDFHPRGRIWSGAVRAIYSFERALVGRRRLGWLVRMVLPWAFRLWMRPRMTRAQIVQSARMLLWKRSDRPRIAHLLAALGKTPQWLMGGFAEEVAVDRRCRGFFHDEERKVVYGYLLGIDLVPTRDGVVCHEANLNAGISERMRRRFWDVDPIPEGLAAFAAERQLKRVIWVGADLTPLDPWFYGQLHEGLRREGIALEVLEDVRLPDRRDLPVGMPVPARALFPPFDPPGGSLVVRLRSYRTGPDSVIHHKEEFARAVGPELARMGHRGVSVLPLSPEPGEVTVGADSGVPNLVYKYPEAGRGAGVFFLRARDARHALALSREVDRATGEGGGLFQRWVSSSLLPGRKIYEYRAMVLVTPAGVRYLGARRRETVTPIPLRLPLGIVEDRRPFIINGLFGNVSTRADPLEEPLIRDGSLALAKALAGVLTRGFRVEATDSDAPAR